MSELKHWLEPDWPAPENIHAATTLRSGGVSTGVFASLNPALHVGDDSHAVLENRQIIRAMLKLPSEPVWLEQVHSSIVINAALSLSIQQADASYSTAPGVVCAVMTADCLPVLVCDSDGKQIAAIHAGWRGLLAGVIDNTLMTFQNQNVLVWLGPAIGPECFEVGNEVREAFVKKSSEYHSAFKKLNNDKWLADIYQLARIELLMRGIESVYGGNCCTFTDQERFYSYRRDKESGRMVTLIWRE